jgi:tRNA A-37 threonylcarbamoyl transferase component Bud32
MSNIDQPTRTDARSQRVSLSYRSVPTWAVGAAFTASLLLGGVCAFQMLPCDQRIAPPELSCDFRGPGVGALSDLLKTAVRQVTPPTIRTAYAGAGIEVAERQYNHLLALLATLSFLSAFLGIKLKDRKLMLDASGLKFPSGMLPDLDWRQRRSWNDVSAMSLSGKGTEADPRCIQIYFKSGGRAALKTERLSNRETEQFFLAFDQNAPHVARSPDLVAFRHELFNGTKAPSFTQMWEEEMNSRFASTNFVALAPPATLQNGNLKIALHLSSGGLSAVYLAESKKGVVVVKESVVPEGTNADNRAKAKELFQREARMLMNLDHPKIARVIDHFQENERDYLVLEYIPGVTLREYIRRHGPQSEERVAEWSQQIAAILKYLHEQDPPVLHRDLTPDNLMLTPDGDVVLIDFGAANQFLGRATGTIVGKQFYISPEQFRGKAVPASDIYSLGGTMFYLLTGLDPEALSTAHPRATVSKLTAEMDAVVARCTEVQVEKRFTSARELLESLASLRQSGTPAPAKAEGTALADQGQVVTTKEKEKLYR